MSTKVTNPSYKRTNPAYTLCGYCYQRFCTNGLKNHWHHCPMRPGNPNYGNMDALTYQQAYQRIPSHA